MSRPAVRVFQSSETLPTRRYDQTDVNPPLFVKAGHWSSPYPYALKNRVQRRKRPKTYPLAGIENEYIRLTVCPDIGGHLFRAIDRATGEDLFHRKAEMLPGRFSVTGAWIPVGVEYNFPVSHSAVTLQPLRSEVRKHADGSASIYTTDQCLISRMVWICETRLTPGKAIIENFMTAYNPTPWPHRWYYWLNACADGSETTRIVLPAEKWTRHGRGEVRSWPVHDGRDHSYVENLTSTTGIFARNCREDFFGVYDPMKGPDGFGTIHVADYRVVPGKKLFTWGNNPRARKWDIVVDAKGTPYLEIQTGLLEDQSDYAFLKPYESMSWRHAFVAVHGLGATCARACEQAAVNVEIDPKAGTVEGRFNCFESRRDVRATLRVGERVLAEKTTPLRPADVICVAAKLPPRAEAVTAELCDRQGTVLISHTQPVQPASESREDAGSWLAPQSANGNGHANGRRGPRALFTQGLFWERYGRHAQAEQTYRELLEKSPDHLEALVRLSSILYRHGLWADALARAERVCVLDPECEDGPVLRGLALWRLGRLGEALDGFWVAHRAGVAPRMAAWHLAILSTVRGERTRAVEMLERTLEDQPIHPRARALLACHLPADGRTAEAVDTLKEGLRRLPCDVVMGLALHRIRPGAKLAALLGKWIDLSPDAILEAVTSDIDAGLWGEAFAKIRLAVRHVRSLAKRPMLHYVEAWLHEQLGRPAACERSLDRAAACGHQRVFPARVELLAILEWALARRGDDGLAHLMSARMKYSLGRSAEAMGHWRAAIRLLPPAVEVQRSFAFATWEATDDPEVAARELSKALAMDPTDLAVVAHLDRALASAGRHDRRSRLLRRYRREHPAHDGIAERMLYLHAERGEYRQMHELLMGRRWRNVHGSWVRQYAFELACRMIAEECQTAGRLEEAIEWHRKCATEPTNLGVDHRAPHKHPEVNFRVGRLLKKLGRREEAKAEFGEGASDRAGRVDEERTYYIAGCQRELGRRADARKRLMAMHRKLERATRNGGQRSGYAWFRQALALEGLGRRKEAAKLTRKAIELGYDERKALRGGAAFGFI